MIELTKEEVQAVINTLSEMPYKMSASLIAFFNKKLTEQKEKKSGTGKDK